MTATAATPEIEALKRRHRQTWAAGRYTDVADRYIADVGEMLVERLGLKPGMDVLDLCTGAGLAAIPAARKGARVTGLDLVPELLECAAVRAQSRGLSVRWIEGDAEDIPLPDASFDAVISTFGIQFTPRHDASSAQVARVLRPDGVVGLVNWTPGGFIGQVLRTLGPYLPPLPEGASPTGQWGREEHIQELFAVHGLQFSFERGYAHFRGPSPVEWVEFMADRYGPLHMASRALPPERWSSLRQELIDLASATNVAGADGFDAPSEYVIAIGRHGA
jgi:SAM-dependent methyltransferase